LRTPLTVFVTALVAGAAAGTALPSWLARLVTDDPTAATVVPTGAPPGAVGLLPLEPGAPPRDPPPGDPPEAAGSVPVVVAAPLSVTCPPGSLPERMVAADGAPKARAADPTPPVREPGAVGAVDAERGVWDPLCGCAVPGAPWADLFDDPC
jgi:hypothetical protein